MTATAQINVRLDPEVKTAGDAALASVGLSPSQTVRLVWEHAARRGESLERMRQLLVDDGEQADAPRENGLRAGRAAMGRALDALGLTGASLDGVADDDLLEQELLERSESLLANARHRGR